MILAVGIKNFPDLFVFLALWFLAIAVGAGFIYGIGRAFVFLGYLLMDWSNWLRKKN